jgi:hypothetical protein
MDMIFPLISPLLFFQVSPDIHSSFFLFLPQKLFSCLYLLLLLLLLLFAVLRLAQEYFTYMETSAAKSRHMLGANGP